VFTKRKKQSEADELNTLIYEERKKQEAEIVKRMWCVEQATITDAGTPQELINNAKAIYDYVYENCENNS